MQAKGLHRAPDAGYMASERGMMCPVFVGLSLDRPNNVQCASHTVLCPPEEGGEHSSIEVQSYTSDNINWPRRSTNDAVEIDLAE